jgi:hypothetical protein
VSSRSFLCAALRVLSTPVARTSIATHSTSEPGAVATGFFDNWRDVLVTIDPVATAPGSDKDRRDLIAESLADLRDGKRDFAAHCLLDIANSSPLYGAE